MVEVYMQLSKVKQAVRRRYNGQQEKKRPPWSLPARTLEKLALDRLRQGTLHTPRRAPKLVWEVHVRRGRF